MATIPTPGSELRHVRKTITFTGAAGAGAVGTITLFTITGRVRLDRMSAFCTVSLVSTGGTGKISLGVASSTGALSSNKSADAIVANDWFTGAGVAAGISTDILYSSFTVDVYLLSESLILTVGTADITSGTLVFDAWYRPITDDGALAGDDIDQDSRTWFWAQALSDIASVPAITASAKDALNWLFALARNKLTQTATTQTLKKDDGTTTVGTASVSDDGTTFTRNEWS